jgi:TonB family protein
MTRRGKSDMSQQTDAAYAAQRDISQAFASHFPETLLIAALVVSFFVHVLIAFFWPSLETNQTVRLEQYRIGLAGAGGGAQESSVNNQSVPIPEVSLDSGSLISLRTNPTLDLEDVLGIAPNAVAAVGLVEVQSEAPLAKPNSGAHGDDLKEVKAKSLGDEVQRTSTAQNQTLTLAEVLPVYSPDLSGINLQSDLKEPQAVPPATALTPTHFKAVITSPEADIVADAPEVMAEQDSIADAPVIDAATLAQMGGEQQLHNAGITSEYKNNVRNQLLKALGSAKPEIERRQLTGALRFKFVLDRDGDVIDVGIKESSGNPELDRLIVQALKNSDSYPELPRAYLGNYLTFTYPVTILFK